MTPRLVSFTAHFNSSTLPKSRFLIHHHRNSISTSAIHARLVSPQFRKQILSEYRTAVKYALAINFGLFSSLFAAHATLHAIEEIRKPTPDHWSQIAKYSLRRARMGNSWIPLIGADISEQERLFWIDKALERGEELVDVLMMKAACLERSKRWDDAKVAYLRALEVGGGQTEDMVEAWCRVAKISAWQGLEKDVVEGALRNAISTAYPDSWRTGTLVLPEIGSRDNSAVLMGAVTELAVETARWGDIAGAIEMLTNVLIRRRAAAAGCEISDPCKEATVMAMIGELVFSIGGKNEGVRWCEGAFEKAWKFADQRIVCKQCANIAAENLVKMGKSLKKINAGEGENNLNIGGGWFWQGKKKILDDNMREGERLEMEYSLMLEEVQAIRAIRDAS